MILLKNRTSLDNATVGTDNSGADGLGYEIPDRAPTPERRYAQSEEERILAKAIRSLQRTLRELVEAQQLQERSIRETAKAATSVTGFMFPFHKFMPSHAVGIISLLVLVVTIPTLYVFFHLAGPWRRTYVIGAVISLYLNVFVSIAQFFMKIPALKALAPTQSEPPFPGTEVVVMLIFIVLGFLAAKRFPAELFMQLARSPQHRWIGCILHVKRSINLSDSARGGNRESPFSGRSHCRRVP